MTMTSLPVTSDSSNAPRTSYSACPFKSDKGPTGNLAHDFIEHREGNTHV
jgi:hypothetical protein